MQLLDYFRNLQRKAFSEKYLLLTNMSIALVLSLFGDLLEQHFEHNTNNGDRVKVELKFDLVRARNMGLSGCLVDVICHYWYQLLERFMPEHSLTSVIKKIILDQLICTPIYIAAFFIAIGILEQETSHQIWKELKTKAWHLYLVECMIWPVAQFINFYWLPCRYRVLYDNLFALGFDIYTSRIKHFNINSEIEGRTTQVFDGLVQRLNRSVLNTSA